MFHVTAGDMLPVFFHRFEQHLNLIVASARGLAPDNAPAHRAREGIEQQRELCREVWLMLQTNWRVFIRATHYAPADFICGTALRLIVEAQV